MGGSTDENDEPGYRPAFYPAGQVHSPVTPYVADWLRGFANRIPGLQEDVFMKVGASSTVSTSTLHCFAGDQVDLGDSEELGETLDFFLAGDAAGTTPFDRVTQAAEVGRTAAWAIAGDPSPLELEFSELLPRYALVHFGTNDMGMGSTYASAMPAFYESMSALVEGLATQGAIPLVTGISPRGDSSAADEWVPSYNAMLRGIAQTWQVPFIDLWEATRGLDGGGLAGDGIHLNGYSGGPCILTESGLEYGYNVRNLIVLEALDRVARAVVDEEPSLDASASWIAGEGTPESPFLVQELPFTHFANTSESSTDGIDLYTGCASEADESGPEHFYRIELREPTALRAMVLDRGEVDIDIHLLDDTAGPEGCIQRAHRRIETTLEPGTYYFSLDSWVDAAGSERSGEYLFVVLACEPGDSSCD